MNEHHARTLISAVKEKLIERMREFFKTHGRERTYWLAYSGGLDSHVLISLCHELNRHNAYDLRAIYINHGLSTHATDWALHCERICKQYGIKFTACTLHIEYKKGESLEALARQLRYARFADYLTPGDMLLTAHQEDDQAETLLLQLLRGAGLKGLSAMPNVKPFAQGFHARPLLSVSRSMLIQYAKDEQLVWIEDESNQNTKLTRNFIRHQILPLLKNRFPSVTKTLSRTALHCAKADQFIDEYLAKFSADLTNNQQTLSVSKLLLLSEDQQKLLLRHWIARKHYPLPSEKKLIAIQQNVLTAAWDRNPCVTWQGAILRRYRDQLFLEKPSPKHDDTRAYTWNIVEPLTLPNLGTLRAIEGSRCGLRIDIKQVCVKFRCMGQVVFLPRRGHHTLKNIFQELAIPPWERSQTPLIFIDNQLIGIVGYYYHEDFCAKENERAWLITLDRHYFSHKGEK